MNKIYQNQAPKFSFGNKSYWGGLVVGSEELALLEFVASSKQVALLVVKDLTHSQAVHKSLNFYNNKVPIVNFLDYEVLAYDSFSPHQDIISSRLKSLALIPQLKHGIVLVTVESLLQRLCPKEFVTQNSFIIKIGDSVDLIEFSKQLIANGYYQTASVQEYGEFNIKGSLLDIFPAGANEPYRLDLFDNIVEDIRSFDVQTQLSIANISSINILPAKEFSTDKASIEKFKNNYQRYFDDTNCLIYDEVINSRFAGGIEFYLPLFFDNTASLFDYLPDNTIVVSASDLSANIKNTFISITKRHTQVALSNNYLLPPEMVFLTDEQVFKNLAERQQIITKTPRIRANKEFVNYPTKALPLLTIEHSHKKPLARLLAFIDKFNGNILLVSESLGRQAVLLDLLTPYGINPQLVENWLDFCNSNYKLAVTVGLIDDGFILPDTAIISELSLFGNNSVQQRRRRAKHKDFSGAIKNLVEINIGDAIVHEQYGVGRYLGLKTMAYDDISQDFMIISYANDDKLSLPISDLNLVGRYSGIDVDTAPLHRLGSQQWAKAKKKAIDDITDIATDLLEIYAKRATQSGFSCLTPGDAYNSFVNEFTFEETPDQITTTAEVLADMCADKPMDRLVCGDVGFGKTEIAMRAAFVAVESGKQVAILVPTTLLAQQHYDSFVDRFAAHPITIGVLSRFKTNKEQKQVIDKLKSGSLDIIIGTHKLIADRVVYKDLGLIIIDEEHRFGVKQKEKLKSLRIKCDILTMSATPIPRTLNMALGQLRELSVIATPPLGRLSVKTFVGQWEDDIVIEACMREIHRAGQIFVLHNDIDTIDITADKMSELVPNAKVRIAHGRMSSKDLEAIMRDFYHQRFHVLVCTTIIETGIDIPSANTIIINNAQNFGLAQLHQLRGRVGRSHHRAYAYLMTKPEQLLTSDAKKRLHAIASLEEIGSGFMLANHDLEIRGSGELLGKDQSGRIQSIGFNLYHDILARTVAAIKTGKKTISDITNKLTIDSGISCIIPAHYMADAHIRLMFYKRISQAKNNDELGEIRIELIDRFGILEPATESLFASAKLRLLAQQIAIISINIYHNRANIVFATDTTINPDKIITLIQTNPSKYRLKNQNTLVINDNMPDDISRIDDIYQLLKQLNGA